ncbi:MULTISPECIES: NAD(P)-dependent malic enzyme [Candidatus Nitrosocaldus]|jgi:malate dehydrogenase (oxaloacetate-decarboxylating)|uniref:NAD(P)-dependent malic enzyme n=1 Tax=Candidatus Nitrosocaldus cavascurensis TaxID=2058097 RepID=A0A2K5APN1_9ARCH|nr:MULTISPECIES: malic enzyme-like NAD(P)-binding protein [Candidatus Nitrosocaldus]SPC33569.1 NAD(P)-dependent malic enzyme [Candidatus Nitrosocaldus cavascurensis]
MSGKTDADDSYNAITLHKRLRGKIEVRNRLIIRSMRDISLVYTPGVADVAMEIARDKSNAYIYTSKWNNVAIVTDGSRVLGLGDIGAEAALPVMEGKAMIFRQFGGVYAFPICLATKDKDEIIRIVKGISPSFAAISIEDIESPKCLAIVDELQSGLDIPVFHDDQHGTAVAVLAALLNALRLVGKRLEDAKIVVAGAGAAGYGIVSILHRANARNILVVDSTGIISRDRKENMNPYKLRIAEMSNPEQVRGSLQDAIKGADVFIGVSGKADIVSKAMVGSMSKDAIVFALTNPVPEIPPYMAKKAGARIVATGRSDYHNQINNAIVFPSLMRAMLDLTIKRIEWDMLIHVAFAIADLAGNNISERYIIPNIMDNRLLEVVRNAVKYYQTQ